MSAPNILRWIVI